MWLPSESGHCRRSSDCRCTFCNWKKNLERAPFKTPLPGSADALIDSALSVLFDLSNDHAIDSLSIKELQTDLNDKFKRLVKNRVLERI